MEEGTERILKIVASLVLLALIILVAVKMAWKVNVGERKVAEYNITQVSADISGTLCAGIGEQVPVYDFSTPQPGVPINVTVNVQPLGYPVSSLVVSSAELKFVLNNGNVTITKKFSGVKGGKLSTIVTFPDAGTYTVYVSAVTNLGSVYNKQIGQIIVGSPYFSGQLPVKSKSFTLKLKGYAGNPVWIKPEDYYYTPTSGVLRVYVPLVRTSDSMARQIANVVGSYLVVEMAEKGIALGEAISTSKYVSEVVYEYLANSPSSNAFATVKPVVTVNESVGDYFLPKYLVSIKISGEVEYPAIAVNVSYHGNNVDVKYAITTVKGSVEYPATVSIYSVYLNNREILEYSEGSAKVTVPYVKVVNVSDNSFAFEFTSPETGGLYIYYETPYQTPAETDAPVIVGGKVAYYVSVPIDYSFSSLQGVEKVAEIRSQNSLSDTITLYFTKEDFVGKSIKEAVEQKLAKISSIVKIDDPQLVDKVVNAVMKATGGKTSNLKYETDYALLLSPVKKDNNYYYYVPQAIVRYDVQAVKVAISFTSSSIYTQANTYPLEVGLSKVSASVVEFSDYETLNLSPSKVLLTPAPDETEGDYVVYKSPPSKVEMRVKTVLATYKIPSITLNNVPYLEESVVIKPDNRVFSVKPQTPGKKWKVISKTGVINGIIVELVETDNEITNVQNFPLDFSFGSMFTSELYGEYYITSETSTTSGGTAIVVGDSATTSPSYSAFVFYGVKENAIIYSPTVIENITVYNGDGEEVGVITKSGYTKLTDDQIYITNIVMNGKMTSFVLTVEENTSKLIFVVNGNLTNGLVVKVLPIPYVITYRPASGSLTFLRGDDIVLNIVPLVKGKYAPNKVNVVVKNYVPSNYSTYLDEIIDPSGRAIISNISTGISGRYYLNDIIYVGNISNYSFTKTYSRIPNMMNIYLIPLKVVSVELSDKYAYFPKITLTAEPAKIYSEYNESDRTYFTFEKYEKKFKLYITYTVKNGTAKAYVYTNDLMVSLTAGRTTMTLDPSYYTVFKDGDYTVLKISSFPVNIQSETSVTLAVSTKNPLFGGEATVDVFKLKPSTQMNNLLLVPKDVSIPYYNFNDISLVNVTVEDTSFTGGLLTLRLPDTIKTFSASGYTVYAISDTATELYIPYPNYNPFKVGLTAVAIPIPSGNTIMSVDELDKYVKEIDVSYTTDYLSKTFAFELTTQTLRDEFIKVLKAGDKEFGVIVVPIDPLIASSIVSNPINFNVKVVFTNGYYYAVNYLLQPILVAYNGYNVASRYAYILSPRVSGNTPKLYYSEVTGKSGDDQHYIENTKIDEADPSKPEYTLLIEHLKPFNTTAEEWLFDNAYNYEQLTIKPVTSGGYFPIDYPNEVYVIRTPYGPSLAFYIGGATNLNFQITYNTANYTLKKVVSEIEAGKIQPSYTKTFQTKDGTYIVKIWLFIPSDGGVYAYVYVDKLGKPASKTYFRISGYGFSFEYAGHKFSVCWAWLTNDKASGFTVSMS